MESNLKERTFDVVYQEYSQRISNLEKEHKKLIVIDSLVFILAIILPIAMIIFVLSSFIGNVSNFLVSLIFMWISVIILLSIRKIVSKAENDFEEKRYVISTDLLKEISGNSTISDSTLNIFLKNVESKLNKSDICKTISSIVFALVPIAISYTSIQKIIENDFLNLIALLLFTGLIYFLFDILIKEVYVFYLSKKYRHAYFFAKDIERYIWKNMIAK